MQELEPNVHNGDCINVQDTDYLVQALSIRFKLVRRILPRPPSRDHAVLSCRRRSEINDLQRD